MQTNLTTSPSFHDFIASERSSVETDEWYGLQPSRLAKRLHSSRELQNNRTRSASLHQPEAEMTHFTAASSKSLSLIWIMACEISGRSVLHRSTWYTFRPSFSKSAISRFRGHVAVMRMIEMDSDPRKDNAFMQGLNDSCFTSRWTSSTTTHASRPKHIKVWTWARKSGHEQFSAATSRS